MLSGLAWLLTSRLLAVVGGALGMPVVKVAAADSEAMSWNNAETLNRVDRLLLTVPHMTPGSYLLFKFLYLLGQRVTFTLVISEKTR